MHDTDETAREGVDGPSPKTSRSHLSIRALFKDATDKALALPVGPDWVVLGWFPWAKPIRDDVVYELADRLGVKWQFDYRHVADNGYEFGYEVIGRRLS